MSNCIYCGRTLNNNQQVSAKCKNCNTVWCANGNCNGSSDKQQPARNNDAQCTVCKKPNSIFRL